MVRAFVLIYDYVDDVLERRGPHRDAHLAHVRSWHDDGRLAIGGATGDPPSGALFVFEVDEAGEIEEFVVSDPYGDAGLVTAARIEPWSLVVQRELAEPPA